VKVRGSNPRETTDCYFLQLSRLTRPATCSQGTSVLHRGQSGRSVMFTTHLYLVQKLRISGAVTLLPMYTFKAPTATTSPVCLPDLSVTLLKLPRFGALISPHVHSGPSPCSTTHTLTHPHAVHNLLFIKFLLTVLFIYALTSLSTYAAVNTSLLPKPLTRYLWFPKLVRALLFNVLLLPADNRIRLFMFTFFQGGTDLVMLVILFLPSAL
jgi:hypothetical protein